MYKKLLTIALSTLIFTGCVSVPMESPEKSELAKKFAPPPEGKAGFYIYRSGSFGSALKKDIWVDGECVGETAPNMFFYKLVEGNKDYKISTESEFSPNDLIVRADEGENYFIRQYIKLGVFLAGANVEQVTAEKGREEISELEMAQIGNCSK